MSHLLNPTLLMTENKVYPALGETLYRLNDFDIHKHPNPTDTSQDIQ